MPTRYVSAKSTYFYRDAQGTERDFVLIYGDEVQRSNTLQNGRYRVQYRGRTGWVRADRLMTGHPLEMYFIDVGQGDAAFFVTPAGRKVLVDGGKGNEAFQFLVWKYRLDAADAQPVDIDLLVVSHVDDDHIKGLLEVVQHRLIRVRRIVHSGIAKYNGNAFNTELGRTVGSGANRYLATRHDRVTDLDGQPVVELIALWRDTVAAEVGVSYGAVDSTTGTIDVGDPAVTIHVLGPRLSNHPTEGRVFHWLGSESETINGHSVVLRLDCGDVRVLLPGDVNTEGARHLLAHAGFAADADSHVLKAPHHGSHKHAPEFLRAVHPQIAVVSSGETPDHGHPRANFLGRIGRASRSDEPLLFSTELVAQFAVDADAAAPDADDDPDPTDANLIGQARRRFKKRLNGLINIRTDGRRIYCARRVAAAYQFVTYDHPAQPRDP